MFSRTTEGNPIRCLLIKTTWYIKFSPCFIIVSSLFELQITPSHYLRENGLTTDQRLALLCKQQRKMSCWRPGNDVVVEPAIVVFQNYKSGETHQVPINIRNTSKVRTLRFIYATSLIRRNLKFNCLILLSSDVPKSSHFDG